MRISDWSSDVCASVLQWADVGIRVHRIARAQGERALDESVAEFVVDAALDQDARAAQADLAGVLECGADDGRQLFAPVAVGEHQGRVLAAQFQRDLLQHRRSDAGRSEEHTSELQSLMRISYAVFCLKKKKHIEQE